MKKLVILAVIWQVLNCSAYCETGNPTASGVYPVEGVTCAMDKLNGVWVPFGSKVHFPNGAVLEVQDRFGAGHDNQVDLYKKDRDDCIRFGRQNIRCMIVTPD
ncbi:MAG: 3D domain-containing protein [Acidaminococcaceae bacterium]|nr:3D domain-containing protein [Acidaminococcaceae bacterium]